MTQTWPVAVIGGGIAGAAAVLTLAQHGVAPLWLAPARSDQDQIGESLAPAANRPLADLGVADLLNRSRHRRSNATYSAWGGERLVERNAINQLEGAGWVVDRPVFEHDLRERAARFAEPLAAVLTSARRESECWRLELEPGGVIKTDYLIDASGRSAVVGRQVASLKRTDQQVAAFAFLDHVDDSVEPTKATLIEAVRDGWWYAALLPDGRLVVSWFTDPDFLPRMLTRNLAAWRSKIAETTHIRRWIEDAGFEISAPPALASAGTTWLEPCAGAGWAAAGDAAAAFDPLSSHGMTTALWSGRAAAIAIVKEIAGETGQLDAYASTVAGGIGQFLDQRARFYGAEWRFVGAAYWDRRQVETPG